MLNNTFVLQIEGTPSEFGDQSILENFRFPNGKAFPKSYKSFVKNYGYGLALGEFHIYIPMGNYGDSLTVRSDEIRSTYIDDVKNDDIWFDIGPDCSLSIVKRLFPFASSDNGYYLFWDYEIDVAGELDIYITDFKGTGFRKAGKSIDELISNLTGGSIKEFLPFCSHPLPRTFKCLKKVE
jgi:hypothetical protein